jgi:hypothetical protein
LDLRLGFPEKDPRIHRNNAYKYASKKTHELRETFFKQTGTRWFEFARLPYFDAVRMTVVDPMHNLLIGA